MTQPNPYLCPKCGNKGVWRRGYEFEGEKICLKCNVVWCPEDEKERQRMMAEDLVNQGGDGI